MSNPTTELKLPSDVWRRLGKETEDEFTAELAELGKELGACTEIVLASVIAAAVEEATG